MSSSRPSRDALVATARESIARGSKSFGLASRLFDRTTRERAWLLYAWCRACDDLADGQDHGGTLHAVGDPAARIAAIRSLTARALDGEWVGEASFDGLRVLLSDVPIPRALIEDHIAGFALDAEGWRPRTEGDLIRYCYHVAGTVGRMMALLMDVAPDDADTLERAEHLGLAFQLANIARDVREDAEGGRCYLPGEWLEEHDGERETIAILTRRLAGLAAGYEASARVGARRLPFRSRWAVLAAAGIYGDIAREVARRGTAALDSRVVISRRAKLAWVVRAFRQAL
ncbi:phytoene/squalene synthase family protein [Sphingomonas sp. MAH-20]|uniref:Phytoene/squalene synthase family protein n=1 Tax=Sphingomonas horti TaxID=2682842 RepID=A0A6I4J399_9SPHN|nr:MULTISPECIES: phytoene/squalene synthase family protein [Sphingomonas]MBA2918814.1 phytoene/squalene synthase family protein [Sphingomonas sp. CGMCC 1.13658]MVO78847.1 phytoene/squalene synthase family protein [Sphingomonas horti]